MSLKVGIMQPYVFPYIGYFSLLHAVDTFVFYDDVNFIQRHWINRNRILINQAPYLFTIPLSNGSQNELIQNVRMHSFPDFRVKFLRQLEQAYKKAPHFQTGMNYVSEVLAYSGKQISELAIRSITTFSSFLGMEKQFLCSSSAFADSRGSARADRLIRITGQLQSSRYINAAGGESLYEKSYFEQRGICLSFIRPDLCPYRQAGATTFIPGLSIIDAIMNNDKSQLLDLVANYTLD